MIDGPGHRHVLLTLVHGTWARGFFPRDRSDGTRWFDQGSRFRGQLEAKLAAQGWTHEVRSFPWTGSDSILERDDAARELANQLRSQDEAIHVVIAHSHGGNVALRALHVARNCENNLPCFDNLFVATMATPFLRIVMKPTDDLESPYYQMQFGFLALIFSAVYLNVEILADSRGLTFLYIPEAIDFILFSLGALYFTCSVALMWLTVRMFNLFFGSGAGPK